MRFTANLTRFGLATIGITALLAAAGCNNSPQGRNDAAPAESTNRPPAELMPAMPAPTASTPRAPGSAPAPMAPASAASAPAADPPAEAIDSAAPTPAGVTTGGAVAAPRFAEVVAVQPVTHEVTTSTPREVCRDEQVQVPRDYKDDKQVAGTVIGGLVGGAVGNQIGKGDGRKLATIAGVVGGAVAGHEIQQRHQQKNATDTEMRRVCHTVEDQSTRTETVGYDVTWRWNGRTGHVQMDQAPAIGSGLPVRNGKVVAN